MVTLRTRRGRPGGPGSRGPSWRPYRWGAPAGRSIVVLAPSTPRRGRASTTGEPSGRAARRGDQGRKGGPMGTKTRWRALLGGVATAALLLGTVSALASSTGKSGPEATATLSDASGNPVGTVSFFTGANGKVEVRVKVSGLVPGFHGMHV